MAIGRFDAIETCQAIVSECLKTREKHGFAGIAGRRNGLDVFQGAGLKHHTRV